MRISQTSGTSQTSLAPGTSASPQSSPLFAKFNDELDEFYKSTIPTMDLITSTKAILERIWSRVDEPRPEMADKLNARIKTIYSNIADINTGIEKFDKRLTALRDNLPKDKIKILGDKIKMERYFVESHRQTAWALKFMIGALITGEEEQDGAVFYHTSLLLWGCERPAQKPAAKPIKKKALRMLLKLR